MTVELRRRPPIKPYAPRLSTMRLMGVGMMATLKNAESEGSLNSYDGNMGEADSEPRTARRRRRKTQGVQRLRLDSLMDAATLATVELRRCPTFWAWQTFVTV